MASLWGKWLSQLGCSRVKRLPWGFVATGARLRCPELLEFVGKVMTKTYCSVTSTAAGLSEENSTEAPFAKSSLDSEPRNIREHSGHNSKAHNNTAVAPFYQMLLRPWALT